jgi:hypothetical protein
MQVKMNEVRHESFSVSSLYLVAQASDQMKRIMS